MSNEYEMQQSMEYTMKLADGILLSATTPLDAVLAAVGTLAQAIHTLTPDDQRDAALCRTYLSALDTARRKPA